MKLLLKNLLIVFLFNSTTVFAQITSGPTIGGLTTFIDSSTGTTWLRLDNFFNKTSNQMIATANAAGFALSDTARINTLFSGLPLTGGASAWDQYASIMGRAPNRALIWGAYNSNTANYGWAYSERLQTNWYIVPNIANGDEIYNSGTPWTDMNLWAYFSSVIMTADTQQSLINTASALQSSLTLQNTVMVNSFTYDCPIFDKNGICISAGGRNTQVNAGMINNTNGLLIGSYRLDKNNSRIGLSLDQNLTTSMPGGTIKQSNNTPMVGVFGVYQENLDNTGWEGKVSLGMGQKDTTIQRSVVGTSEPGVGSATMLSQGAQVLAKYGFGLMKDVLILPYAGMRYTRNNMGGYTEATSAAVTAPLVMNAVKTNSSAALIGIEGRYRVLPGVMTYASAGVERNMSTNYDDYVATNSSIGTLAPVSMNPNMVRTRPTATLGAYYDVEKNQRLGITGIYRQEMYQAVGTTTVMATYTVGL